MQIEYIDIDKIIPYANNPRNNDGAVEYVKASISEFGFKVPIVVDQNRVIVCGHTRYRAAKELNIKTVPCIVADDLTEEKITAYRLADNKTSEFAEWDFNMLEAELSLLGDIDMSDFGFEIDTISADGFGTEFELPNGDKSEIVQMTFTLHEEQKELICYALERVKDCITETFGNDNKNGNALYEVVRQWAEQRK